MDDIKSLFFPYTLSTSRYALVFPLADNISFLFLCLACHTDENRLAWGRMRYRPSGRSLGTVLGHKDPVSSAFVRLDSGGESALDLSLSPFSLLHCWRIALSTGG